MQTPADNVSRYRAHIPVNTGFYPNIYWTAYTAYSTNKHAQKWQKKEEFVNVPNKKAKSSIWEFFYLKVNKETQKAVENVAICRLCDLVVRYSGGTSNITSHITRHHPSALKKKLKTEETPINTTVPTSSHTTMPTSTPEPASQPTKKVQATLTGMLVAVKPYSLNTLRGTKVTSSIARYIVQDLRPLSVVEGSGFRDMIKTLDPRYPLPSRPHFSETVIPRLYEETVSKVKACLFMASVVALTTDGWTSHATESYVTITSVHITPDWELKNFVLQTRAMPDSHTGVNIAGVIREAIVEWGLPGNPPLVTDNAANMNVAAQHLQALHIGCFAHTLNLAAQKALKIDTVSRLLEKVRRIVGYFHRSTTAAALLKTKINQLGLQDLKLRQDVQTRWIRPQTC